MASQAQIEANRRNSQKSTGPRTDAGKAASSQNATRSGLYANALLIDGEDPDELDTLTREYLDSCRPVGPRERAVVDSLIHTDWLLRRMRRLESQDVNSEFDHLRKSRGSEFDETYGMVYVYIRLGDRLDRLQRRVTTLERLYHRRLVDLERLQAKRGHAPEPQSDAEPPSAPRPQAVAPPVPNPQPAIGFVPSELSARLGGPVLGRGTPPAAEARNTTPCPPPPLPFDRPIGPTR